MRDETEPRLRIEEYLPDWYRDDTAKDLVLSDDIDSLVSCAILKKVHPEWNIKYFYNFKALYEEELTKLFGSETDRVWVDVAVQNDEKAFDNHVSCATRKTHRNPNMINPNHFFNITTDDYHEKYCGSTAMMLWALYNLPEPESDEGKAILWNIDVGYKGILSDKFKYYTSNYYYYACFLELEDMKNWIYDNKTYDFYSNRDKYKLNSKIVMDSDGYLKTNIDLERVSELLEIDITLPTERFELIEKYKNTVREYSDKDLKKIKNYEKSGVLTAAFTRKNILNYSRRIS